MSSIADVKRWISKDEKEAIVVLSGEFWLVHIETKSSKMIGRSIEEAREILKELDKHNDFIDLQGN
ncbi:MAG: hypothetical protein H6Q72_2344 [Firmicutes bacterium]|nr:hypothetical protein [Bacillota bacterium]